MIVNALIGDYFVMNFEHSATDSTVEPISVLIAFERFSKHSAFTALSHNPRKKLGSIEDWYHFIFALTLKPKKKPLLGFMMTKEFSPKELITLSMK